MSDPYDDILGGAFKGLPRNKIVSGLDSSKPAGDISLVSAKGAPLESTQKQTIKFRVTVEMKKAVEGKVLFLQKVTGVNPKGKKTRIFDYAWDMKGMISYVRQMQEYARESLPQWARQYYKNKKKCPNCHTDVFPEHKTSYLWEKEDPESFNDKDLAECLCGWKGTVHDLWFK